MDKPWVTGPKELLEHGVEHLNRGTAFDLRMAMICIDNSVELVIKTFLGLPRRISGIEGLSKKKFDEVKDSFTKLLEAFEEHANDKLIGIELGEIEWFHRKRNQLYHDGNGITVEKPQVDAYKEIAVILFKNLFSADIEMKVVDKHHTLTGEFIIEWAELENAIHFKLGKFKGSKSMIDLYNELDKRKILNMEDQIRLLKARKLRNELIHGAISPNEDVIREGLGNVKYIAQKLW